ncbi:hypothetical protein EMPG_11881 [Blastomyces silverae]|uniref:Uncharacterized protein n=1 Tax=Blastomyces silverae TaxID=2060906 RepID=A0A0H1BP58_9EURO|nr:hypothetical protein EMPG_11881 [Blastomyces silverae]
MVAINENEAKGEVDSDDYWPQQGIVPAATGQANGMCPARSSEPARMGNKGQTNKSHESVSARLRSRGKHLVDISSHILEEKNSEFVLVAFDAGLSLELEDGVTCHTWA